MDDEKYCVYCHTSPSGKKYYGITKNPRKRWGNGSGYSRNPHFHNAIVKYGWDNFTHEILHEGLSWEAAGELERQYIEAYHTNDFEYGYNRSVGGENPLLGRAYSDEERRYRSERMRGNTYGLGYKHTDEARQKISEAGHRRKGGPLSDRQLAEAISHLPPPRHGVENPAARPVMCVELNIVYPCGKDAAEALHLQRSHISNVCRGKREKTGGYHFRFWEGDE